MLTNLQVEALKPAATRYLKTDKDGLCIDVLPSGVKSWVYRYRLNGKQEKTQLGQYPKMSLKAARLERGRLEQRVKAGTSPAEEKRKKKIQARGGTSTNPTVREFCDRYYREQIEGELKDPAQVKRYIDKEICPRLGEKLLRDVSKPDIQELVYSKRDEGKVRADDKGKVRTALHIRGTLKRIFDYAVEKDLVTSNPAQLIKPKFIGKTKARKRALKPGEIRCFLRTLNASSIQRQFKLALQIGLATLTRKSELRLAEWTDIDLEAGQWYIPPENTKMDTEHIVFMSTQVTEMFRELKVLACGSRFVLPGRSVHKPLNKTTLNNALYRVTFDVPPFTIHDLRRTASTVLHNNNFLSDAIEISLGHKILGIRGVYNAAEYADQRRPMLQWWSDYIDSLVDESNVVIGNFGA